jgi:hypothetical protein
MKTHSIIVISVMTILCIVIGYMMYVIYQQTEISTEYYLLLESRSQMDPQLKRKIDVALLYDGQVSYREYNKLVRTDTQTRDQIKKRMK